MRRWLLYSLTYDDAEAPSHYSWKVASRLDRIEERYEGLVEADDLELDETTAGISGKKVREILEALDDEGRWITNHDGSRLSGQTRLENGSCFISSKIFSYNMEALSQYLRTEK